jgi:hypothetical protein
MIPRMKSFTPTPRGSWFTAALFAIVACAAHAQEAKPVTAVTNYRPVFQECHKPDGAPRLTIRRMEIGGTGMLLTVDPATLATSLEREQDWSCADTDDQAEKETRLVRAVRMSCAPHAAGAAPQSAVIANGGMTHAGDSTTGSFITGDLCPSHRPFDRDFLTKLRATESPLPIALAISGEWLTRHGADFQWLRDGERAGAWKITWVDHSYRHPYVRGVAPAHNFLLTAGVDMQAEILGTERLLIANGETPSVFFRFPGLISNAALMRVTRDDHLIVLGADAWLALSQPVRPGGIILLHLNGNEPQGLKIFSTLLGEGKLPRPFRSIEEAP